MPKLHDLLGGVQIPERKISRRDFGVPPANKAPSVDRQIQLGAMASELLDTFDPFESYAEAWDWIESHNLDYWFEFELVNQAEWFCFRSSFLTIACYRAVNPLIYFQDRMRYGVETWEAFITQGDRFVKLSKEPASVHTRAQEIKDVNRVVEKEQARRAKILKQQIEKEEKNKEKKAKNKIKQSEDGSFELTEDHIWEFNQEDLF